MRDRFLDAYLEAAVFTLPDDEDSKGQNGFAPEAIAQATRECAAFQEAASDLLLNLDDASAGHDFWLTRNRHGAGFWDRGLGMAGEMLTDLAHKTGERDLYAGDDGYLYFSPGATP